MAEPRHPRCLGHIRRLKRSRLRNRLLLNGNAGSYRLIEPRYLLPPAHETPLGIARYVTFGRFVFVGLSCTLLTAGGLYMLSVVGRMDPRMGGAISYLAVVPFNYVLHRYFTFSHIAETRRSVPKYLLTHFVNLTVTVATVDLTTRIMGLPTVVAIAALVLVIPILQFLLLEGFVFVGRRTNTEGSAG